MSDPRIPAQPDKHKLPPFDLEGPKTLVALLGTDVQEAATEWHNDRNNQFKRRAFVHFVFANIEGVISITKQGIRIIYDNFNHGSLSPKQIDWLMDKGFFPLKDNLIFSFKVYAAVLGTTFHLNLNQDKRWGSVLKTIGIRNRLTHPKHIDDMSMSDEEMSYVVEAFRWFTDKVTERQRLFSPIVATLKRQTQPETQRDV